MSASRGGRLAAGLLSCTGAVIALRAAGAVLPAPALTDPASWPGWAGGRDPLVAAFSVLRLLAIGATSYCVLIGSAGVVLRLFQAGRATAVLDRLTVPPLRRLVVATVTVSLSAGFLGTATASAAEGTSTSTTVVAGQPPPTITMHRLVPNDSVAPNPTVAPTAPKMARTWAVQPGQCFWSIAEAVLHQAWGREPTSAQVVPYWHRLIEANRPVLADSANPDLVFSGQVFTLPDLPSA
ncbi:MAG: LysM peptidoglycan-binding domain-containing protein [Acidimicrobiales bacterium]